MTLQFRRAASDDLEGVWAVLMDGKAVLRRMGVDQWQGSYPSKAVVRSDIDACRSYVIEEHGRILATAVVDFSGEPAYDNVDGAWLTASMSENPCYAVLRRVASLSSQAGRGLGRMLLEAGAQTAHGHGSESIRIVTHPDNGPMLKLIERCGFTRCGVVRIDHAEGDNPDRIAFEKLL